MSDNNNHTPEEKPLEVQLIQTFLSVGEYRMVNQICRNNGLPEYRPGPIKPYGPDQNHIFYLHDYYPKGTRNHPYSEKIRQLKNGSDTAAYDFAMEILGVIKLLKECTRMETYQLTCIPSHLTGTRSRMHRCIEYILELNDDPELSLFSDGIELIRTDDVTASHDKSKPRPSEDTQFQSVLSGRRGNEVLSQGLIILDDITTTGRQMNSARKHLKYLGFDERKMISLVLGKTVTNTKSV